MRRAVNRLTGERRYIVRNVEGGTLLERFFVSGVVAFVLLRLYLELTGFPKVGGHGLHIAHMLWGGLLMLIANVVLLGFLGDAARKVSAVLGGVGFGIFIDELGKFITSDNNYFYQPAIALIYAIFVGLFFALRVIERRRPHSEPAYLVNALHAAAEVVLHGCDRANRDRALALLAQAGSADLLAVALRDALDRSSATPEPAPGHLARAEAWLQRLYLRLIASARFDRAVIAGFIAYALLSTLFLVNVARSTDVSLYRGAVSVRGDLTFTTIADALVLIGAISWRRSRPMGLLWFKRSILVTILLVQPFLFYREQLAALLWLALDVVVLETLNYSIGQERLLEGAARRTPGAIAEDDGAQTGAAGATGSAG